MTLSRPELATVTDVSVLAPGYPPQRIAIGGAAVGLAGREGHDLFRKALGWTLIVLPFMCVVVDLRSTAVLGWMVP